MESIFRKYRRGTGRDDLAILWELSRPYAGRLAAAGLCSIILSAINGAIAWSVKPALDSIFIEKRAEYLYLLPIGVILLFLLRGVFTYCNNYLMSSIGAKIVRFMRQEVYQKLLSLPMSFFGRNSSGNVVSKILNDIGVLQGTVGFTIKDFLVESCTVVVLAGVAISRKWDLAVISFVVVPVIVYSIGRLGSKMKKTSAKTRLLIAQITTIITESLQGIKIIKAFTMESEIRKKNEEVLAEHYRNSMRETRINEFSSFNADVIAGVGISVIVYYGGSLVLADRISSGDFFSFIAAILLMYTPLKRLSRVHNNFQQGRTVLDRIGAVLAEEPEKQGGDEISVRGDISFDGVYFRYPESQNNALDGIDLSVKHGEIVALVGYSGAGKSTLVDLVAGFWYPTGGTVYIDGKDMRSLSLRSLRVHIGAVTQDIILFDDTIKANILFGRPGATDREVVEAAVAANAHEFIMELPEGYETRIGERGIRLSGGQKQRITIARAIIRNPSILILDEATSSLDTESEHLVQQALEKLMNGRTTIVIAHRLSTVKKATRIAVMSGGRIIQEGSHEELLARSGLYQELYNMQFRDAEVKGGGKNEVR
ncbi:MAG TPA: ABC transporter transmembrane domain-containing protein [Dissulfurispiraceae bacterium]|nr:ABC transporter transmembrane domain-containing protein [Dissulfurispiraceae bacterium]